ncbi:HAMP domain-containing sensor histidine kinase [Paenibacillus turpanensis]|uniref:HAMP domain-containing sensor histidine kinase n=1 Tax=Paenibacillus turpanensis TaxID=2689078 RepID=UPI001FB64142|nr:HAMP domain-containing sensor histidine kinase [Paenibacillus turpanensis]
MKKRTTMLSYWTFRYLLITSIGLALIAFISYQWIQQETMDNRLRTAGMLAQEIADRAIGPDGRFTEGSQLGALIGDRKRFFRLSKEMCVMVIDKDGKTRFSVPDLTDEEVKHKLNDDLTESRNPEFKAAVAYIEANGERFGRVVVTQAKWEMTYIPAEDLRLFGIMLAGLAGLSWLTIYLLSRKLTKPIREMVAAAKEISQGKYDIALNTDAKEREIHELLSSFDHMAGRLKQLEHGRAVMLAGVSHELKTPVTSIKGLVHAVREDVVQGQEAHEFLDIALQESERLQRMVTDLLDYNSLSAGAVTVRRERLAAAPLISEIVYQWRLTKGEALPDEPQLLLPQSTLELAGDPLRIQQIVVNLLNNSLYAQKPGQPIGITVEVLVNDHGRVDIAVSDRGKGVRQEEQELIFEPFYRGAEEQSRSRGLGLGLPFSRRLAQAMGGELRLDRSSAEAGSRFVLTLPVWTEETLV